MRAHPRSRGENWRASVASRSPTGSSPLTRGKHPLVRGTFAVGGLIPAHAGKTGRGQDPRRKRGAHPRSRGENTANQASAFCDPGSSPLTRGKRRSAISALLEPGLIPAHAGKTGSAGLRWNSDRAHPRSRGENSLPIRRGHPSRGSSPLTRGKLGLVGGRRVVAGLIPAHAGKTLIKTTQRSVSKAHPRSRGENLVCGASAVARAGSSPLTRGKLIAVDLDTMRERLIPAHAGKTGWSPRHVSIVRAHPRSRGENASGGGRGGFDVGSSPLTRGKLARVGGFEVTHGLIPAHAGKTHPPRRAPRH